MTVDWVSICVGFAGGFGLMLVVHLVSLAYVTARYADDLRGLLTPAQYLRENNAAPSFSQEIRGPKGRTMWDMPEKK